MKLAVCAVNGFEERLISLLQTLRRDIEVTCIITDKTSGNGFTPSIAVHPFCMVAKLVAEKRLDGVLIPAVFGVSYGLRAMRQKLESFGITQIYYTPAKILRKIQQNLDADDISRLVVRYTELNQLQHLQFHTVDICNLRCKGCQHFSNIAKYPNPYDLRTFRADMMRLGELFDNINRICILGGEPFLNKEIQHYCEISHEVFPYSRIDITTNGLLLENLTDEQIDALRRNKVQLNITLYEPTARVRDAIAGFLSKNGIRHFFGAPVKQFSKKMRLQRKVYDTTTSHDHYTSCRDSACTFLRDGKIFPCYFPATVDIFNAHFGVDISNHDSFIDIHATPLSGPEIIKRLEEPFDICSHCTEPVWDNWEHGSRNATINDWIVREEG